MEKIEALKQKQRDTRSRIDERNRSKSKKRGDSAASPKNNKDSKTNSVEFINFNPPEKQFGGDEQNQD